MAYAKRAAINSLVATMTPETANMRQAEIEHVGNTVKRAGLLAIHAAATSRPAHMARSLGYKHVERPDLSYIGRGIDSMVFRKDEEVLKINNATILFSPAQRRAYAEAQQGRYADLAAYMGGFVVPQELFIGDHPGFPGMEVVQIRQPYIRPKDPMLFPPYDPIEFDTIHENVTRYSERQPGGLAELGDFADRSWALQHQRSLLPDIIGVGNLTVAGDTKLKLVDGDPVSSMQAVGHAIGMSRLQQLTDAVDQLS